MRARATRPATWPDRRPRHTAATPKTSWKSSRSGTRHPSPQDSAPARADADAVEGVPLRAGTSASVSGSPHAAASAIATSPAKLAMRTPPPRSAGGVGADVHGDHAAAVVDPVGEIEVGRDDEEVAARSSASAIGKREPVERRGLGGGRVAAGREGDGRDGDEERSS